jgi:hypothetical protein
MDVGTSKCGRNYKTPKPLSVKSNNASKYIDVIPLLSCYSNVRHKICTKHAILTLFQLSLQFKCLLFYHEDCGKCERCSLVKKGRSFDHTTGLAL